MTWQAHISDEWVRGGKRVIVFRRVGHGDVEVIKGFDEFGGAIVERQQDGTTASPMFAGFVLPPEAVDAIAAQAKPGPTLAEVERLEAALAKEQERVDGVLLRLWDRS